MTTLLDWSDVLRDNSRDRLRELGRQIRFELDQLWIGFRMWFKR